MVCIIKDFTTLTITYKIGVTNLEFTLALTVENQINRKKLNHWYVPMSLRVKDRAVENSVGGDIVDFIFCKNAGDSIYKEITFRDDTKVVPEVARKVVDRRFWN